MTIVELDLGKQPKHERAVDVARETLLRMGGAASILDLIQAIQDADTTLTEADAAMAVLDLTDDDKSSFNLARGVVRLPATK